MSQFRQQKDYVHKTRMYKLISFCFVIIMAVYSIPISTAAASKLSKPTGLSEHHAYAVVDADTGDLLLGDSANSKVYPASTTKLMAAIVILEHEGNNVNKKIKITSAMLKQVPSCLARYGMKAGEQYSLDTLMHMSLIASDGDAIICAAIATFGSVKNCIKAMNKKVKSLNLTKTSFDNPAGLDIGDGYTKNYSTAYEIAMITRYAMENNIIRGIVAKPTYQVKQTNGVKGYKIKSTNKFFNQVSYDTDNYTIIGTKTGTTNAAGHVFAATAIDDYENEIICVYMGKKSSTATFEDIRTILNKVFTWLHKEYATIEDEDEKTTQQDEVLVDETEPAL